MTDLHAAIGAALDEQEADAKALRGPFRSVTPHALRRIEADRRVLARHAPQSANGVRWCKHERTDWPCDDVLDLAARYDVDTG